MKDIIRKKISISGRISWKKRKENLKKLALDKGKFIGDGYIAKPKIKKKLFIATIRVAVNSETCCNCKEGACDFFSSLLSENKAIFDWSYGSKKGSTSAPEYIEINSKGYKEGNLFNGLTPIKYL
jgi:hypothetical protein